MKRYIVMKNWIPDDLPLFLLKKGDEVNIVKNKKSDWKGWLFCKLGENTGWVPDSIIQMTPPSKGIILEDYSSKELRVRVGEPVIEIKRIAGWMWCIQERTVEVGWLPLNILVEYEKVPDEAQFLLSKIVSRETSAKSRLRPLEKRDAQKIYRILKDVEVRRFLAELPNPYKPEDAKQFINFAQEWYNNKTAFHFAITTDENDELIGVIGIRIDEKRQDIGHIGFWLEKKHWNKGFTRKSITDMLDFAFCKLKLNFIRGEVFDSNFSSKRLLISNGFSLIGISSKPLSNSIICEPVFLYEKKNDFAEGCVSRETHD
ncbi:MAG: GNAT family N-acetyltransferase [Ignavibacteriales bacterium]|jgi:RimJ/RimL family protein N-acetyltransferase|nr:GNAT family N-acetyltransferase [Ignavibacteriales bacterium]HOJ18522.1 GNAT family N-acetyltransferase [Ignavibacteriaceae bacterium]HPO56576.1 GNAT family N-acetyltransferase [Ignavibacteriaceae bacterium]